VIGEFLPRSALDDGDVTAMHALFTEHFDNVSERCFRTDLARKDWVLRIRRNGVLLGFSSLQFLRVPHGAQKLNVLCSGDTIVSPEARFSTVLARTWIGAVRELGRYYAATDLHWLLLVSGFRTYRFLPVFWRSFYPCHAEPTPPSVAEQMNHAARMAFGSQFAADEGVVRFTEPQICRADRYGIDQRRLTDPHVRFFAERNPGYARGDELVCWARLAPSNLTSAGTRILQAHERDTRLPLAG